MRVLALILIVSLSEAAEARMYQWINPSTGTVQFSGEPPSWYRSPTGGERVLVFEKGELIDDTAIELPEERSAALRQEALRESEARSQIEALRRLESAAHAQDAPHLRTLPPEETEQSPETVSRETIERLKSIIADWDTRYSATPEEEMDPDRLKAIIQNWDRRRSNEQPGEPLLPY